MDNNMNNMGQPVMQQPVNNGTGFDVNKMINDVKNDKKSLIALGGALLVIIANFLTLFSVKATIFGISKSESTYFFKYSGIGKLVFFLAIGTIVLVLLKKLIYTACTAGLSLLLTIYQVIKIQGDYKDTFKGYEKYVTLHWGIGLILTFVGLIAIGAAIYLIWKEDKNCFTNAINGLKNIGGNKNAAAPVAPVQPQAPVQPVAPVAPVQPQASVPTENINNDINNNIM